MNVLIINGNPKKESYSAALAHAYQQGALDAQATLRMLPLRELKFDLNLSFGYGQDIPLEPDLQEAVQALLWADHLVWVYPLWWTSYPALMKGFIDRTFLPHITYKYEGNSPFPKPLLKGKTARIICTADSPYWYNKLFLNNSSIKQLKKGTLEFCGVKPVRTSFIGPIRRSTLSFREKWLEKVYQLGVQMV